MRTRRVARTAAVMTAALAGVSTAIAVAAPAHAHVEVSADNPQAGAMNVTVTFDGEAESKNAGIVSERVVLPAGIAPADVRLAKAPDGWTFTASPDGYTVAGKALPAGTNAVHSIIISQVPSDATALVFKTVETYGNGKVSRWIEVPEAGQPEPDNPAPVLTLKPAAAPVPTSAAPTSAGAGIPSAAAATTAPDTTPIAGAKPGSNRGPLWITLATVVAVVIAGTALAVRRRRAQSP